MKHQVPARDLAYAIMFFHQGFFHKAYDIVFQFDESSLHYKLRTRLLLVRCLYEIQLEDKSYFSILVDQTRTFELFIKREYGLHEEVKLSYLNFSAGLRAIIHRKKNTPSEETNNILLQKIESFQPIIAKDWLIDKIHQLK